MKIQLKRIAYTIEDPKIKQPGPSQIQTSWCSVTPTERFSES